MFSAVLNTDNTISLSGDERWSCFVHGNFGVSKYSGTLNGEETLTIIIPDNMVYASGRVLFSHGADHCDYIEIPIFFRNDCYVATTPSYNEQGNIVFFYTRTGQTFSVDFDTYGQISESDVVYSSSEGYITDGSMLVYPTDTEGGYVEVTICGWKKIKILLCPGDLEEDVPEEVCDCGPTGDTSVTMTSTGGTFAFTFAECIANVSMGSNEWAHSSVNGNTVTITVDANESDTHRSDTLTFTYQLEDGSTCGSYSVEIWQGSGSQTYCECYEVRSATTVTADSSTSTSAEVSWSYRKRNSDGSAGEWMTSSTTVTFDANTGTGSAERTGEITMTGFPSCDGADCGDDVTVPWKVIVPGADEEEPDFSMNFEVGVNYDYGTHICDIEGGNKYIVKAQGESGRITIAQNFSGRANVTFRVRRTSLTEKARTENMIEYFIWDNYYNLVDSVESVSFNQDGTARWRAYVGLAGRATGTITMRSGGVINLTMEVYDC